MFLRNTILCLFLIISVSTFSQEIFTLKSRVLSSIDSSAIGFAHIINKTTNYGVISDYDGAFSFAVSNTDTLQVSIIGYETTQIAVSEISTNIYINPKDYKLDEFTVIPYKNFEEFKKAFAELHIPDTSLKISPLIFMFEEELFLYKGNGGFGIVIEGGLSKLYDYFSKHGKSLRRYKKLLERDRYKSYLATRFNNETIKKSVPLKLIEEIEEFKEYLDFSDEFIAKSNDYDLIKRIQDCYKEYLIEIKSQND